MHHTYSDTEGRVAVWGDAFLSHYRVGEALSTSEPHAFPYAMVVGGTLILDVDTTIEGRVALAGDLVRRYPLTKLLEKPAIFRRLARELETPWCGNTHEVHLTGERVSSLPRRRARRSSG